MKKELEEVKKLNKDLQLLLANKLSKGTLTIHNEEEPAEDNHPENHQREDSQELEFHAEREREEFEGDSH